MIDRNFITPEMRDWALDNSVLITDGSCGFGRPCVGISRNGHWVSWRDHDQTDNWKMYPDPWVGFTPPDAYHKVDLVCVLGPEEVLEDSWRQLGQWLNAIIDAGWTVHERPSKATGLQAIISGTTTPYLKKPTEQEKS